MQRVRTLVRTTALVALGPLCLGGALLPAAAATPSRPGVAAAATTTTLSTVGRWNLDDRSSLASTTPNRNRIAPVTGPAGDFPGFPSDVTVREGAPPVTTATGHSFYFPGWHARRTAACPGSTTVTCSYVDPLASLASIPDPTNALSPGTAPTTGPAGPYWSVQLDLRADPLDVEVSDPAWDQPQGVGFGPASPNIAQQGKAAAQGQWKISQHPVQGSSTTFTISCDFIDGATGEARSVAMPAGTTLSTGVDYHVMCALLRGGIPRLTVSQGSTQVVRLVGSYPQSAYTVLPDDDVYLGKKCGRADPTASSNTHANDAFAGYLDNVRISSSR